MALLRSPCRLGKDKRPGEPASYASSTRASYGAVITTIPQLWSVHIPLLWECRFRIVNAVRSNLLELLPLNSVAENFLQLQNQPWYRSPRAIYIRRGQVA